MALGALTYLAEGSVNNNTTATSGSFTPTAGATLLVGVAGRLPLDPTGVPTITDSLTPDLGWQEVEYGFYDIVDGFRTQLTVFRATVPPSPVPMTVTGAIVGAAYVALIVTQIAGANPNITNANNNKSTTGNVTTTIATPAGTSTTVGFYAAIGSSNVSPDAAYTEVRERTASTSLVIECAYDAGGDASASWTSANARCVLILFEVTEAGGESASGYGALAATVNLGGSGQGARKGGGALANTVRVGGGGTLAPTPPVAGDVTALLLEDGFSLLIEDGSRLLLEVDDVPVGPDPGPQSDNVHHGNVRLGGRGGRVFIPVVPDLPFSGIAGLANYEVSIEMTPTSRWILRDVRAVSIERSLNTWPGGLEAGTAEIMIDDASGRYWPARSGITPNMGVRVLATWVDPENSIVSSYHLFTGLIDAITTDPQIADRTVQLTCRDRWKLMQTRLITTTMMIDWPVGSILAHAFNQAAIDVSQRSIDQIVDVLPFAWVRNITIAAMLDEFLAAGGYGAYVAPDGIVRIRDRYFDAGGAFVSSAVYTDTAGLTLSIDDAELVNQVTAQGTPYMKVNSVQPIARISAPIGLAPQTFTLFNLGYQDPRNGDPIGATGCFQAVANSDYQLNTASDGTGTNLLSTMSATTIFYADRARVSIFNPSSVTVWATGFQVRGVPILAGDPISVTVWVDSSSVIHGVHDGAVTSDLFATHDLLERRAYDVVEQFAAPLLRADLQMIDDLPTALRLQLTDVVIITNSHTGLNSEQFTVHGISHELRADDTGIVHQMGLTLVRAREIDAFILDTDQVDIDRLSR